MTRLYSIVALCGAVVMALEILSSRLLAPQFGNSVYVWGSIISVFLAALSIGYYLGGRLADRWPRIEVMAQVILFGALGQSLLLLGGKEAVTVIGEATHGAAAGTLLAATLLFGPPSVLLAMVSPFAVRLAARDLGHLGNTTGRLYAVSTAGSLVGTLGCTFAIIPFLELKKGLSLLVVTTVFAAILGLVSRRRRELPSLLLALFLVAHALSGFSFEIDAATGLIASRVTPYQTLEVIEDAGIRSLRSDRVVHTSIRLDDGLSSVFYARYAAAALIFNPQLERVLFLGMGAGAVGTYLEHGLGALELDFVDIDPAIPELAERYFGFTETPNRRVIVEDARHFLRRSDETWDFVYCDTYVGAAIPFHLTTAEFFESVREHLSPGGVVGVNLATGLDRPFPRAIFRTLREKFAFVEAFAVPHGNTLLVAGMAPLTADEMRRRAQELDRRSKFEPSLDRILADREAVALDLQETPILRDAFAPVNWMVRLDAPMIER